MKIGTFNVLNIINDGGYACLFLDVILKVVVVNISHISIFIHDFKNVVYR